MFSAMVARALVLLMTAASFVLAQVQVTSPTGGGTVANTALSVQLSGASGYNLQIQVVVGGMKSDGTDSTIIYSQPGGAYTGGSIAVNVPSANGPNAAFAAYYLKVTATPSSGSPSVAYSQRFTLTGMSGGWASATIQSAAQAAAAQGATAVPANAQGAAGGNGAAASIPAGTVIPYSMQTGIIKYAPMQSKPGTKITQTNTAPLYPASSWNIFTTMAPIPIQISTATPSATYSTSSRVNTASPAPMPSDDMAKFLARWKD